jgi:phosphate transport system protein
MGISRVAFEEDLSSIYRDLLTMGARVEEDLRKAVAALTTGEKELAYFVKQDDAFVNSMQIRIEDSVVMAIATQQPVGKDLRELVAVLRISPVLERIGDYAVHLAKTALKIKASDWPSQVEDLARMGEIGALMIRDSVAAFMERDVEKARECAMRDDEIDERYHRVVAESLAAMKSDTANVDSAARLIKTASSLERLGDHVTNLCELTIYLVEGVHEELNE